MRHKHRTTWFAIGFGGVLALLLGLFASNSTAVNNGALMYVFGSTTATCDQTGQNVAADYQDSGFGLELQQFWPNEPVRISFTFPDGRVLSPVVTSGTDDNSVQLSTTDWIYNGQYINTLDGVIDMPENFPWRSMTTNGGDLFYYFPITNKWPFGCYSFTALGEYSNRQTTTYFAVIPRPYSPPPVSPAALIVEDNTTGATTSQQGAYVDIFGRGFVARELVSIWITAPDGTVIDFPYQPVTSDVGSFAAPFVFNANHPTGSYAFTALGNLSGYQVVARFELTSRTSTTAGLAQLRVAAPYPAVSVQGYVFEVQGKRFQPYERVDIWMTLPDNSVVGLPSQYANFNGEFFADMYVDERLPTGEYDFTAKGDLSGALTITTLYIAGGDPNVPAVTNPDPAPEVIDSNDYQETGDTETLGPPPEQVEPFESPADPVF
jgi:hypothetical protein